MGRILKASAFQLVIQECMGIFLISEVIRGHTLSMTAGGIKRNRKCKASKPIEESSINIEIKEIILLL